jgi:membrane protease YdiL (CAAX protease family)
LVWLNIARISIAGILLGAVVSKLVMLRPYYLERLRPGFWLPIAKGMRQRDWSKLLLIALAFAVVALALALIVGRVISIGLGWQLYSEEEFIFTTEKIPLPLLFVTVNLLPIFEEWVFRGILLEEASRRARSRSLGVLVSAAVFALFHLSNPGTYPAYAIPLLLGGILLGACYLLVGLGGAVLSHCTYNSILLLMGV